MQRSTAHRPSIYSFLGKSTFDTIDSNLEIQILCDKTFQATQDIHSDVFIV